MLCETNAIYYAYHMCKYYVIILTLNVPKHKTNMAIFQDCTSQASTSTTPVLKNSPAAGENMRQRTHDFVPGWEALGHWVTGSRSQSERNIAIGPATSRISFVSYCFSWLLYMNCAELPFHQTPDTRDRRRLT